MTEAQASDVIRSVTGLSPDHPHRLTIAKDLAEILLEAVRTLVGDAALCNYVWCRNPDHYELKA